MIHGEQSWTDYPSYLHILVPRVLEFLARRDLKITFFIVGRDATFPENQDLLGEIVRQGHSVANHSFDHKPWLHRYTTSELVDEFARSEEAIESATGTRTVGFRGPGFSLTDAAIEEMVRRGYRYDATVFPNILNPLSRAYYFKTTDLTPEQAEERSQLFGKASDALRPNRVFKWKAENGELLEIPVSTFPGFRTPIHLSYLTYLGGKVRPLASFYFRTALTLSRIAANPPSMLLHPLDFLGKEDDSDLAFFPGMDLAVDRKLELASHFLDQFEKSYQLVPIETYATSVAPTKTRLPDFG